jgi:hypothetical protein
MWQLLAADAGATLLTNPELLTGAERRIFEERLGLRGSTALIAVSFGAMPLGIDHSPGSAARGSSLTWMVVRGVPMFFFGVASVALAIGFVVEVYTHLLGRSVLSLCGRRERGDEEKER